MRAGSKYWLAAGLCLAGAALVFAWRFQIRQVPPEDSEGDAKVPLSEFRGVRLVEDDPDGMRVTVTAESGSGWEARGTGALKGVHVVLERRGRRVAASAASADVSSKETIALSGDVEVRWDQYAVRAERATYHRGEGLVRSDAAVALEGPGLRVSGKGFEVDVDAQRARVLDRVTATIQGRRK